MRTETLSLVISGDGKRLGAELRKSEGHVKSFSGKVGGMFAGIGKGIRGAVGKLSPLAMVGGGAGIMMAAKNLMDYQDALSSLGIAAGMSSGEMMGLDKKIQDLAYSTGQSREQLVGALKDMASEVDKDFAVAAIENVGKSATAMSIDIGEAAQAFTAFRRDMGATEEEAAKLFNTMVAMDNTIALKRLGSSVATLGLTKDNFADYNAWVQTAKSMTGGADAAANAIDQIAMSIQSDRRIQRELGPGILNPDGTIKDFRKLIDKMSAMGASGAKAMFGAKNAKAFLPFADGKGFEVFDGYIRKGQEANFVTDAFARKQGEAKFQISALSQAAKEFGGAALSPVLAELTAQLNALTGNPEAMEKFRGDLMGIAEGLGAVGKLAGLVGKGLGAWGDMWGAIGTWHGTQSGRMSTGDRRSQARARSGAAGNQPARIYRGKTKAKSADDDKLASRPDRFGPPGGGRSAAQPPINAEVKNAVHLNVQIAESGRVIAKSDDPNTSLRANVDRGAFK